MYIYFVHLVQLISPLQINPNIFTNFNFTKKQEPWKLSIHKKSESKLCKNA